MDKLMEYRAEINKIDSGITDLFTQRWEVIRKIAGYKTERGIPILDHGREREILEQNSARIPAADVRAYFVSFMQNVLDLSKQFQHMLMEGMNVAYSGVPGAFADIASRRIFSDARHIGFPDFKSAYNAVAGGECDCAVLPIENSSAGIVDQVLELMFNGDLHINGMYIMSVQENLIGIKGSSTEMIRKVISHPQALQQCEDFIRAHGFQTVSAVNTAISAQHVAELNDPTVAAIASEATADLYGLEILESNINESSVNTTKFAIFSRIENLNSDTHGKFILMFTVPDVAGALAKAISVISEYGYNMKVLRSHSMKEIAWQYCFYVEIEGNENCENGRQMLTALAEHCDKLKIIGHYQKEVEI